MTLNAFVLCHSDTSPFQSGTSFGNRGWRRLERARENGYLDARCRNSKKVKESFGLWCWRLKIPLVWFERQSPHSKYGRVHLDLFTTSNRLTPAGREAIQTLCATVAPKGQVKISAHNADCDRVPLARVEDLAKAIFRSAIRNHQRDVHPEWGRAASASSA